MNIVMFHSGKELPSFLECNFKQLRLFNPSIIVYFITDQEHLRSPLFEMYSIRPVNKDSFYSDKIRHFELLYGRGANDFWTITATRLIYIENFMQQYNLREVYHFENDVLIYFDFRDYNSTFRKLFQNMAITVGGPDKAMTGLFYIRSYKPLCKMTQFFLNILKEYGVKGIKNRYKMDMVNEMTLMKAYASESVELEGLPTMPFGEYATHYPNFHSLFDPASWGQYVGGTMSEGPGAKPTDHFIGKLLLSHPEYSVIWKSEKDRALPYFKYDGEEIRINNLHIHSKNLHKYLS